MKINFRDGELMSDTLITPRIRGTQYNLWFSHADIVDKYINQNKIEKLKSHPVLKVTQPSDSVSDNSKNVIFSGGIRVPHLHYEDEIYLLNKDQWNELSGKILKDFSKKLAEAKNVSFSQIMELSEPMSEFI